MADLDSARYTDSDSVGIKSLDSSRHSTSSCTSTSSTSDIVKHTLKDVVSLQHSAMQRIRDNAERQKLNYVLKETYDEMVRQYDAERLSHERMKLLLQKESEKLEFALGEIEILKKHLEREKLEHQELNKSVKQRVNRESQRSDLLYSKCTENEETIQQQKDDICLKENEISNLKQRLKKQNENHKRLLDEMELQRVQEEYLARSLSESGNRKRRGVS